MSDRDRDSPVVHAESGVSPRDGEPPEVTTPTDAELDEFVAEWRRFAPAALRRLLEAKVE